MQLKTLAIILANVKLGDKKVISKMYTKHFGLQSYAIHFGSSSKSKIKSAHLQPLNLIEIEVISKEKNEVQRVNEIRVARPYLELHSNILKNCIGGFLNELLIKTLKESEANEELFHFVFDKLCELDATGDSLAGWPLHFMSSITNYLGIFPNDNYNSERIFFNLADGRFEEVPPVHMNYLDRKDSLLFHKLLQSYDTFNKKPPSTEDRNLMLGLLIQYFRLHVPGFTEFKSLPVLQATLYS